MTDSAELETRAGPAGAGLALRAARTAQNLSVGEVARQLRLSVAQIEALEADRFERLPGPVFVRGFIRNYARLLKLDAETLLRSMPSAALEQQEARVVAEVRGETLPGARPSRWPRYALAALAVVSALAVYELLFTEPAQVGVTQPPVAVPVPVPLPAKTEAQGSAAPATEERALTESPSSAATEAPAPVGATVASGASEQRSTATAAALAEIRMIFDRDSWVEIRDRDGQTIFSQLNRGGTEQRLAGMPPFVVVVGNARGVRLTYNDRPVDLSPYAKYDVARLTLE